MTQITYYGHSSFLVEMDGVKLLFDPFITGNELAKDIDIKAIQPDFIILSHGHQDHILDAEAIARISGAPIISNFEIVTHYQGKGIDKAIPMNHGGTVECNGLRVKMVNAVHTSSFPDGSYAGQPAGFVVINSKGQSFYYSGDTALHYDMKLIGEAGGVDFALLCIGDHFTMGVEDAVKAADFVGTSKVIGMHYDTFPPITLDHAAAKQAFRSQDKELVLMTIGESLAV